MAATLYSDTGYLLVHLIEDIKHGNIALPDIQRPFVWPAKKARALFDSMYRGYPVGTLMFWETGADTGTKQIGGGDAPKVAKLLIVDGQQRLTSLFAVLTGREVVNKRFEKYQIKIAFRPSDETFEVADAAIAKNPEYIPDITVLWNSGYKSTVREFFKRLNQSRDEPLTDEEEDRLEDRIDRVYDLQNFRFQVIELKAAANEEQVADIFVRINSEGVQLNQADFILTLMSVHWEKGRVELEEFARAAVDAAAKPPTPKNHFIEPTPDQLLRAAVAIGLKRGRLDKVYNILRGKDLDTGEVSEESRSTQFARLASAQEQVLSLTNWHEFLKCVTHAGFRRRRMISSDTALIYSYALWLVGRVDFGLGYQTLRGVISRWFFMSQLTGRYTNSPESQIESDLNRVKELTPGDGAAFCAELDRIVRANLTGDYWAISLPNRLDTSSAQSPSLMAYWAALALLDAELLFSELKVRTQLDPTITAPRDIERHHLFPVDHLKKLGITGTKQVNAIGNMAFIDWPENAAIRASDPLVYWPKYTAGMHPDRLKRQRYWHALPVGWEQLDYPAFLQKRQTLIAEVIRDGFNQLWEKGDPPTTEPTLQDLIEARESQTVELKSTARWNVKANQADKKMEQIIAKAVCGFLNAEGGTLVIGVDDEGNVLGLDDDFKTLGQKKDRDGYELFLRSMLDSSLSVPTAAIVHIKFDAREGKDVCLVSVASSGKPVFAKAAEGQQFSEFWVRVGNLTKQLHGDDMVAYQAQHWD